MDKSPTSKREWEQAVIDAYYNHRWRQILEPLSEKFRRWEAGGLEHADMDQAIHEAHKQTQKVYSLFLEKRETLAAMIQWDHEWFVPWARERGYPLELVRDPLVRRELEEQG